MTRPRGRPPKARRLLVLAKRTGAGHIRGERIQLHQDIDADLARTYLDKGMAIYLDGLNENQIMSILGEK